MARYKLKKIAILVALLGLIGPLLWLFLQKGLDPTVFGTMVSMCLALTILNLWDQQRIRRQLALEDVEISRELMEKAQYRAALNRLESALAHDPNCFEVRVARGEIYRCEQAYDLARRELLAAIQIRPDSFRAHFALGLTYLQEKKIFEAVSEFRRTIQLKPDFSEAHFILAQSYELAGEKANALKAYQTFLKVVSGEEDTSRKIADYVDRSQSRIMALQ